MARPWLLLLIAWTGRCDAQGITAIDTKGVLRGYLDQEAAIETQVEEDEELEPTDKKEVVELQKRIQEREEEEQEAEEEEAEEAEEEEEFTTVDLSESLMLLGSILFIMVLFYLVNAEDKDMRYYSWCVISATLSIFSAVLIFSGVNNMIHKYLLPEVEAPGLRFLLACVELLVYFTLLQLGTAWESGAFSAVPEHKSREELERIEQKIEQRTKCWATIMAHITGFASINCGTVLLNFQVMRDSPAASFLAAPLLFLLQVALGWIARRLRKQAIDRQESKYQPLRQSDPKRVENIDEKWREWTNELWDEYVMDAEQDAAALSVSFMVVQSCRFAFSGQLPPGFNPIPAISRDLGYETKLTTSSVVFVLLTVFLVLISGRIFPKGEPPRPGTWKSLLRRCLLLLQLTNAMAFAWTLLFSARWEIGRYSEHLGPPTALASRITLALGISFAVAVVTRMLDCIADCECSGDDADKALEFIINSLGILVGFSWEQSFDGAVEVLADKTPRPQLAELGLAVAVVLLLLPAWRRYILANVIRLEKEREESKKEEKELAQRGGSRVVASAGK